MSIADEIKQARKASGRSVQQLATEAGIAMASWYRAEAGENVGKDVLEKIAKVLKCELRLA